MFWAHVRMMYRLIAERSLQTMSDVAAGTGSMKEHDQERYRSALQRDASGAPPQKREKASPGMLMGIGIPVVTNGGVVLPAGVRT